MAKPSVQATLLRSAICLTTAKPRPCPTMFYYPGLTATTFHDRQQFPWTKTLEKNIAEIRKEYLHLKKTSSSDYNVTGESEHKLHTGTWDWHSFVTKGKKSTAFEKACPITSRLLTTIPDFMTDDIPFAYAFFSTLKPRSSIAAHSAPCNIRLRVHVPLFVPPGCSMRVGDEVQEWKEGECVIFDDSYDHDSRHDGHNGDRVVLLFDVWHPDLTLNERTALVTMFERARDNGWLTSSSSS